MTASLHTSLTHGRPLTGRPMADARALLADGSPQALAQLAQFAPQPPHGCVLAERLRFGPPETWRGWHPRYGQVAVKLDGGGRLRPPPESHLRLRHPGIAALLAGGSGWRVYAWVSGTTLAQALAQGMDARERRRCWGQIRATLDAMHRAGLVHGDITPANVVLSDQDGSPVLIDWGEDNAGTPGWRPDLSLGPDSDPISRDRFGLARLGDVMLAPGGGGDWKDG